MVEITYTFTCSLCEHKEKIPLQDDTIKIPVVKLPESWSEIANVGYVCQNHIIEINDINNEAVIE